MRIVRFRTAQGFEVVIGWLGAVHRFRLNVRQDAGRREERWLYVSREDERLEDGTMTAGDLAERLHEMDITPPAGLLERLRELERRGEEGERQRAP